MGSLNHIAPTEAPQWRWAVVLTLAALVVRWWGIGDRSLWYDERASLVDIQGVDTRPRLAPGPFSSTQLRIGGGVLDIARRSATHDQPVYVTALHLWTRLAGVSETALRLPSAILGAATVGLLVLGAGRLVGRGPAPLAGALLLVSPLHVHYSQEARTYAATVFLVTLSLVLMPVGRAQTIRWAAYGFCVGLVPAWHLLALAAVLPQCAWLAFQPNNRRGLMIAALCALLVLAALLPLGLAQSIITAHEQSGVAFQTPPPELQAWARPAQASTLVAGVFASLTRLLGVEYYPLGLHAWQVAPLTLILIGLLVIGFRNSPPQVRPLLLAGAVAPFVFAIALSVHYGHVVTLQDRYSVWCLPYVVPLLAQGLTRLAPRAGTVPAVIVLAVWTVFLAVARLAPNAPSLTYRLARDITRCSKPSDVVVLEGPYWAAVFTAFADRPMDLVVSGPAPAGRRGWLVEGGSACYEGAPADCRAGPSPCSSHPPRGSE